MSKRRGRATMGLALALSLISASVAADSVFRCAGNDGVVAFQDRPCDVGSHERRIDLIKYAEPAKPADRADDGHRRTREANASARQFVAPRRRAEPHSYECRTETGLVFYRHSRCPSSVLDRAVAHARSVRVTGREMSRSEACRRMRNSARDGEELDEKASTYDRNLGRDTCRDY